MASRTSMELEAGRRGRDMSEEREGHCYTYRAQYSGCGCILFLIGIILLSNSWDTLEPTEYGLLHNGVTGQVDMTRVYGWGRYMFGPTRRFIRFPKNYVTLSYGNNDRDKNLEIRARTGADNSNEGASSGGQPVGLSVSFQYQLPKENIPAIYDTFGSNYETPYMRFSQMAITNVAQQFTPRSFWTNRRAIEAEMLRAVNATLYEQGFAVVRELQLRAVSFQPSYEQTITNIQLQEQLRVTKSYQLDVTRVAKEVDLLQSETDASVVAINAQAARERAIIEGQANAAALQVEQQARATMYAKLRAHLGWSAEHFLQYIKMKALNAQPQNNVVIGVNPVGSVLGA